jgi:type I restriction enzyme S subunit
MMEAAAKVQINKYPVYKDSDAEWLGPIPAHWTLTRLGTKFEERRSKVSDKEFAPLSVTKQGVIPQLDSAAKTNDGDNRKLVKAGDFVINSRSDRKGSSGVSDRDGSVSLINIVLNPKGIHPIFCNYLLKSNGFIEEFYRMGHGIVADLWTTRYDEMKAISIGLPPESEQTAIASFLDRKCALIDKAIAIKEKQIALLKERRQILIQNAVTRGLNPNAKMKDSGVDWIGEIPEHWEVKKLLAVCRFVRGNSAFSKDELLSNGDYVALQYGKVYQVAEIDDSYEFYVNKEFYKDSQLVNHGDTIFISTSETIEDLGHSVFYKRNDLGLLGGEQMLIKPKSEIVNSRFLHFATKVFSKELRKYATGIKVYRFNVNDLKSIDIPLPPFQEQAAINIHIIDQSSKMDRAIALQEHQIEKLKEYKTCLINEAVTGKIKVC